MLNAWGWVLLNRFLDENLGHLFPAGRSNKTSPWLKAEGGLGFPVLKALPTGSRGRPSPSLSLHGRRYHQKHWNNLSLHHPCTPSLSDWIMGGSESTPDAVTTFEIWKWVTWYKGTLVEDHEQERNLETCHRLLARHLSGFQHRKTFQEYVHFCVF